jgi:hypothetical protein
MKRGIYRKIKKRSLMGVNLEKELLGMARG